MKPYSLSKCKKILLQVYHLWRKKKKKLTPAQVSEIREELKAFQDEIIKKNRTQANFHAHKCLNYLDGALSRTKFQKGFEVIFGLAVALAIAFVIRQCWFELYEIPTGSMRPTFKEEDRLIVSKTNYGINIPFTIKHFYFNPDLVKRSDIIVFSTEEMDVRDSNTLYFWIFPGKKQFVKRLMGKPGDTLYFYGGRLYGVDKDGNDISASLQLPELEAIDHVPVIHFDGSLSLAEPFHSPLGSAYRMAIVHQMNEPVARLTVLGNNRLDGEMLPMPRIHNANTDPVQNYYELWGIGNFAAARIVRREEIRSVAEKNNISLKDSEYFLELHHHPNLKHLELARDPRNRIRPQFIMSTSIIPLDEEHLKELFNHLYTGRFIVKNGYAMRYGASGRQNLGSHFLTRLEGVPDGTYEYYYGQAYQIRWGGYAQKLKSDHPLQRYSADLVRKFFNYGIEFDKRYAMGPHFETERFAYFRDGDLFVMGAPLFKKGEPALEAFVAKEKERGSSSLVKDGYIPFIDSGPPDVEKIKQAGLLIPAKSYLALGDNYAMSADSREFGFVPQGNLRGSPSFIFWPPGSRFGRPVQPWFPWITFSNIFIWTLALICFAVWYMYHKRHHHLPLKDL